MLADLADLADLARATVAARQARLARELLDSITTSLYHVGLSLQAAADLPHDAASQGIAEGLQHLDDTIRQIRDTAFTTCGPENLSRTPIRCRMTPRRSLPETPSTPFVVRDPCQKGARIDRFGTVTHGYSDQPYL